jgi:hypothetical protein
VENPFEEFYCFDFHNNQNVKLAVFYCGNYFRQCDIFQKHKDNLEAEKFTRLKIPPVPDQNP